MDTSDILVHSGAEEGIFTFMNTALDKGDHVIVHFPCYQSLMEIASSIGCEVTRWVTEGENNWELDIEFLKKSIKSNTKAIIINCPHNPTGYLMDKQKLLKIVEIAREHNILLFSDEVYRYLEYDEKDRLPAACDIYDNAVSLGVMSKAFGLAGLRIGWIATKNRELFKDMAMFKDYTSICSSAPSEFLAALALKHKERLIDRNLKIIKDNISLLNNFFNTYNDIFDWKAPKAGSIAFPKIKADIDAEKFCIDLVEKKGVLILPGNYYSYGNKNIRVGFGRKNAPQSIEKLEEYMREYF
jgi:aspartate/methionine/tyrosine aminotransferase